MAPDSFSMALLASDSSRSVVLASRASRRARVPSFEAELLSRHSDFKDLFCRRAMPRLAAPALVMEFQDKLTRGRGREGGGIKSERLVP